jgi:hypothetical protein
MKRLSDMLHSFGMQTGDKKKSQEEAEKLNALEQLVTRLGKSIGDSAIAKGETEIPGWTPLQINVSRFCNHGKSNRELALLELNNMLENLKHLKKFFTEDDKVLKVIQTMLEEVLKVKDQMSPASKPLPGC